MSAVEELLKLKNEEEAKHLMRFFKTQKGAYGEGDIFLGVRVPQTRKIVKQYFKETSLSELQEMLNSKYHEIRLCALLMMVELFQRTDEKEKLVNLYIKNVKNINNWDLVDLTAHKIIGKYYLITNDDSIIRNLAISNHLWSERIAIVSQLSILKNGKFDLLIALCENFLNHEHDLIHKSVGWMLREAGKQDKKVLTDFLDKYSKVMPRTMLRYSIEKLSTEQKNFYMKK